MKVVVETLGCKVNAYESELIKEMFINNKDEIIDTSSLGTKEIILKYKDKNKEKEYRFKIKIIDTQAPTIEYQKELPTKTINITRVDKEIVPIKEYIYLDNNISNDKESIEDTQDNNQEKCLPGKNGKVIETKYIENEVIKEVYKVPKYIYLIILLLIITIILMFILKNKKNVDWNY